jgi:hypothetical protein
MEMSDTSRAREFVRELDTYWKFQSIHPDAPTDRELVLTLICPSGLRTRVNHVTVFDANSLLITPDDGGVIILQVEQCAFTVRREKRAPSKKAERPSNVIEMPTKKITTHVIIP